MQTKDLDCIFVISMSKKVRKSIDCRNFPNEIDCTLTMSGAEKEVLKAALRHAVEEHGHKDTPELRRQLKQMLTSETSGIRQKFLNIY